MDKLGKEQDLTDQDPEEVQHGFKSNQATEAEEHDPEEMIESSSESGKTEEAPVENAAEEAPTDEAMEDTPLPKGMDIEPGTEASEVTNDESSSPEQTADPVVVEYPEDKEEGATDSEPKLDLSKADKQEILALIRKVKNEEDGKKLDAILKVVKTQFDKLHELSKNEALQKFVSDGNEAEGFQYHGDDTDRAFFKLYNVLKTRAKKFFKDLESSKEDNLKIKENLLSKLRQVVDGDETEAGFNSVRELQTEWKKVGPVPGPRNRTLQANYNALLDRFYDNRSIYFELKDLDRKKNLSRKIALCEKAEQLALHENLKVAIVQLNELHEEYKHIGSVPKEDQESLWQRFKAASDAIYSKRKDFLDDLKVQFEKNYELKIALITEVETFLAFDSDRISEWNKKSKEIMELQKKWETIGGVPKDKTKDVNRGFWNTFKRFFANKNKFFKSLESEREDNLAKRRKLIEKANELKESDNFAVTADKLKSLQAQWREIGPVPEKAKNETYRLFKAACDHFFERRRSQSQHQNEVYEENLTHKLNICDDIAKVVDTDEFDLDAVYNLVDSYFAIGFVPKNAIKKIQKRFDEVIGVVLDNDALSEYDQEDLKAHIQTSLMKNSPGGEDKIKRRKSSLKRKISAVENDINTYKTNVEFFTKSKTADKMKAEFDEKIATAQKELRNLESQLRSLGQ